MNAYAVGINVGERLQIAHSAHLVFHLLLSQMTEGSLLEVPSAVLASTIVEDEHDVALLCHVGFPQAGHPMPGCLHIMGMRTAIHIHHGGILLRRVEVHGFHHAPVELGLAVSGFHRPLLEYRLIPTVPWVGSRSQHHALARLGVGHCAAAWHIGLLPCVEHITSAGRETCLMYALAVIKQSALARRNVQTIDILLQVVGFLTRDDGTACGRTEAHQFGHHPSSLGELGQLLAIDIHQVKMVEAIALAPHDELAAVPGEERNGMLRFHILVRILGIERAQFLACQGIISIERAMVLVSVELKEIDCLAIRSP